MKVELDDMLTTEQAVKRFQLGKERLTEKCRGRRPKIPVFRLNTHVLRFHPRTIIAKLASDEGVSPNVIAASLGMKLEGK